MYYVGDVSSDYKDKGSEVYVHCQSWSVQQNGSRKSCRDLVYIVVHFTIDQSSILNIIRLYWIWAGMCDYNVSLKTWQLWMKCFYYIL